jgi:hypothetical protein
MATARAGAAGLANRRKVGRTPRSPSARLGQPDDAAKAKTRRGIRRRPVGGGGDSVGSDPPSLVGDDPPVRGCLGVRQAGPLSKYGSIAQQRR